jgi:heme-degrading monooxygenase HmoA
MTRTKFEVFTNMFKKELGGSEKIQSAFDSANRKFEDKTGFKAYSSYRSYLTCKKRKK